ncbi:hypothetical protein GCM10009641_88070 [Mycobacterium cookii]|uniref:AbiTii domain-containing protein n=1 Tax=Nocardioides furvisabuli TaxID=375542 RepID=A0ABP5I970_9ACTN|nr:hypothetical protein [Nocardioides furvisabuli]
MRAQAGLLARIEQDALDGKSSLSDLLRLCITLGGQAQSTDLRDWARRELEGYSGTTVEMPKYRRVAAPLLADGFSGRLAFAGKQLSVMDLPDFARDDLANGLVIDFGVAQLEKHAKQSESARLQPSGLDLLAHFMNRSPEYSARFERIYYDVSPHVFDSIVDSVRTTLLSMVAELRGAGVRDGDVPSKEVADQAVQVVIYGAKRNSVIINSPRAVGAGSTAVVQGSSLPESPAVPAWIRGPWGAAVGVATIAAAYAAFAVGLGWPPF